MKRHLILASLLAMSTGALAREDPPGLYVGLTAGQSSLDVSQDDLDAIVLDAFNSVGYSVPYGNSSLDDSGLVFSAILGYRTAEQFAVEVGYASLGEVAYRSSGSVINNPSFGAGRPGTLDLDVSVKGPTLGAALFVPFAERFDVHFRAGAFFAKVTADVAVSIGPSVARESASSTSTVPYFGAGLAWSATERLAVSLDLARYQDVGDQEETGEASVTALTAGLVYHF